MEDKKRLMILYASETGNALDAAERVGREADRRCCPAVVLSVHEYDANRLPDQGIVIFIVSTTGQGDTPTSMRPFWRFLLKKNLSPQWLERVHYAVFGLGDSGYQKFNVVAKKLDKRLSDLGGMQIIGRGLGDEQHPSGYEGALDDWLLSLWRGMGIGDPGIRTSDLPKFQVIYHDADSIEAQPSSTSVSESLDMQIERARLISPGKFSHERCRPHCFLQMVKNEYLTKEGCGKDVRHFEFEILSQEIRYQVGDVLEILPSQDPEAVDAFIKRCDLNPDLYITVRSKSTENGFLPHNSLKGTVKLKTFVELTMDVASASPRRYFFEVAGFSKSWLQMVLIECQKTIVAGLIVFRLRATGSSGVINGDGGRVFKADLGFFSPVC